MGGVQAVKEVYLNSSPRVEFNLARKIISFRQAEVSLTQKSLLFERTPRVLICFKILLF